MNRRLVAGSCIFLTVLAVAWVISCGGGGSSSRGSDFTGKKLAVTLGSQGQNIPLEAGKTWALAFSVNFDIGDFGGPYYYLNLDLEKNLSGLTFTPTGPPAPPAAGTSRLGVQPVTVSFYVDTVDAADPCATGTHYGPFEVALDAFSQPESVTPAKQARPSETTVLCGLR